MYIFPGSWMETGDTAFWSHLAKEQTYTIQQCKQYRGPASKLKQELLAKLEQSTVSKGA